MSEHPDFPGQTSDCAGCGTTARTCAQDAGSCCDFCARENALEAHRLRYLYDKGGELPVQLNEPDLQPIASAGLTVVMQLNGVQMQVVLMHDIVPGVTKTVEMTVEKYVVTNVIDMIVPKESDQ